MYCRRRYRFRCNCRCASALYARHSDRQFLTTTATFYCGQLYIFQYFDVIFMDHIFYSCHATQTRFPTVLVEEFLVISAI